jgi:hypothetical protein
MINEALKLHFLVMSRLEQQTDFLEKQVKGPEN